jgi:hypothetical protein
MDQTTYRILNKLSSSPGKDYSINSLTRELGEGSHKAYYKNVYDKIKELNKEGSIILEKTGNSSRISINYDNYGTILLLSQLELMKQRELLEGDEELKMLLSDMNASFRRDFCCIKYIAINHPHRNRSLNRQEFLFILKDQATKKDIIDIYKKMLDLEAAHNIKLDCLILRENELRELLKEQAHNPLKEMIAEQTILKYQEEYWQEIKKMIEEGISIRSAEEINPAKIGEKDLSYNLGRFGYKETGGTIEKGKSYAIETIIISLMLSGDARRMEAIPVILSKNRERGRKPIYNLLIFLAIKYRKEEKIQAYLKLLNTGKNRENIDATDIMTALGIKPAKIDEQTIRQKMRLYHG